MKKYATRILHNSKPVLTQTQLKIFDTHCYIYDSNRTILDPLFQLLWNWLIKKVPLTIESNLITFIGLLVNLVSSLVVIYYSPNADSDLPAWTLMFCGIGLFVYQTLDALDGKQARRTNLDTPLAELFDHGCDALSTGKLNIISKKTKYLIWRLTGTIIRLIIKQIDYSF